MCYPAGVTDPTEARSVYPKHFFFQGSPIPPRRSGFSLMPFAPEFDPVYEAIEAAIEAAGYEAVRADQPKEFHPGAVMEGILKGIAEAEIIVADMSPDSEGKENMNVYYEVGIAHTVKENVILVTQDTKSIPFDSRHIRHISYSLNDLPNLTDQLTQIVKDRPPEPYFDYRRVEFPKTLGGMKHEIRRAIENCEKQWINRIIPEQSIIFGEKSADREEAVLSIQPSFLSPWNPVDDLGFKVIENNQDSAIPDMMRALSKAYRLPEKSQNIVASYGPMLALRTWVVWGAYALENENWGAVKQLLHTPVSIGGNQRVDFTQFDSLYHPYIVHNNAHIAARIINQQTEDFAMRYFGDAETMQALIGFWLFTSDLLYLMNESTTRFTTWVIAPKDRFMDTLSRLETDGDFSRNFTNAVAGISPEELNIKWERGARKQMEEAMIRDGLKVSVWGRVTYLPKHFAVG